jgi:hypothetical protein
MASGDLRAKVLEFLSNRIVKHGESVEYGWFIFQTVVENGRLDLETLDFRAMASFTRDFLRVERIEAEQLAVLAEQRIKPACCALWHAALVSRSYTPGAPRAFMERLDPLEANKSGWYIGIANDPLDVNDPANLHSQSLYELTIHDARFAPYWLLPAGFVVEFDGDRPVVTKR